MAWFVPRFEKDTVYSVGKRASPSIQTCLGLSEAVNT